MELVLVAALAENGVLGRDGGMPWHLPEDLRHFRALTVGHPVVMGRRTFESIGRPLPGRQNIVLTRIAAPLPRGVASAASLAEAVALAGLGRAAPAAIMIIGGAQVYALALPSATRMELTRVPLRVEGDTFFPPVRWEDWRLIASRPGGAASPAGLRFETWERPA